MASFKALCLAGVACLAVTVSAHAADLLPPPPPVELPVYAPPPPSGNWYLRGDVGVGIDKLRGESSTFQNGAPGGFAIENADLDDQTFVDGGIGYEFNSYFRADVTGEYRTASGFNGLESYTASCTVTPGPCYDGYHGSVSNAVGLVNGYIDVGTWYGVTPFFGAGIGFSHNTAHEFTDTGLGYGSSSSSSNFSLAYAFMAGLSFAVTQNLKVEIGYRYLDMGNVSSGTIQCYNQSANGCQFAEKLHFHEASSDIRLGLRYTFADLVPYQPPMPLIRKY